MEEVKEAVEIAEPGIIESFLTNINGDPFALIAGSLAVIFALLTVVLNHYIKSSKLTGQDKESDQLGDYGYWTGLTKYVSIIFAVLFLGYGYYKGTAMIGHSLEWMNLLVRWIHMVFGIAWIGASFYFIFLEMALNRTQNVRDELAGNLWAIHGGGFYFLEKYKVAPKKLPKTLHWFKFEAYFTFITGFSLLTIVYYFNAQSMMIDPSVADLTSFQAIGIGLASLVVSWLFYDNLCKSPIGKNNVLFLIIMFTYTTVLAYFLAQYLSPRAAYIHVGAALGTMMAANVFFTIMPGQKALVKAAEAGAESIDPIHGKRAYQRSLHNNYFTLPVMFIMISNHFPSTFGNDKQWVILMGLSLASMFIKHWLNLKDKGEKSVWLLPAGSALLVALILYTAPKEYDCSEDELVPIETVNEIIKTRCVSCHSSNVTDNVLTAAPNGTMFDTEEQILSKLDLIQVRVANEIMPPANKTKMTDEERDIIAKWSCQQMKK